MGYCPEAAGVRPLVVDIGCHRGDDTAYYLAKGFAVLAVEANPALVDVCRARFAAELADGRLALHHVCISDTVEPVTFHVNANDGWSSVVERSRSVGRPHPS